MKVEVEEVDIADINFAHALPFCFVFTAMRASQDAEAKRLLKEAEAAIETRKDFRRVVACQVFPHIAMCFFPQTALELNGVLNSC